MTKRMAFKWLKLAVSHVLVFGLGIAAVWLSSNRRLAQQYYAGVFDAQIEEMNTLSGALKNVNIQNYPAAQKNLESAVKARDTNLQMVYRSDPTFFGSRQFFVTLGNNRPIYRDMSEPSLSRVLEWVPNVDVARLTFERTYLNDQREAPPLNIAEWFSQPATLNDLRGKVVLLDFWGTWCPPCVQFLPRLQTIYDRYKEQGLVVIAVHSSFQADTIQAFLRDHPYTFAIARDAGTTAQAYGIEAWPTKCLIDRRGRVVWAPDPTLPSQTRLTANEEDQQMAAAIEGALAQ